MPESTHSEQIRGAFGTVDAHESGSRHGWRGRLLALLAIIGPGLIVMVGDNDAGGVSTYAQAGQNFGYTLLWTLPLLIPVLIVTQEMVVRLGAVTGVGFGRLIRERISRRWGTVSISSILLLNFLIIVTEFIGISLSMRFFGVSPYVSVPVAAVTLFAVTSTGSFRRWERFMMLFVAVNVVVIPLIWNAHLSTGSMTHGLAVPGIRGGASSAAVLLIISIIGTTVAPWQLFFQESNIVDKRISPRWLNYERADTVIGSVVVVVVAALLVCGDRRRARSARRHERLHERPGRRAGPGALRRPRRRDLLRDHPAQLLDHRRGGRHAGQQLRRRRPRRRASPRASTCRCARPRASTASSAG